MQIFDWAIISLYLVGMITLSFFLGRGQHSGKDYYLAGNTTPPFAIALSVLATQSSTNSFLGIPALVAFTAGAGLNFLQWEIALPLAIVVLMAGLYPVFRRLELVSLYEYLELRFGLATRTTLSLTFQVLRAFSTGVTIYGFALVMVLTLNLPFAVAVIMVGGVTLIYDLLGGMKAVIWSDVIQMGILLLSVVGALLLAVQLVGGVTEVFSLFPAERLNGLDWSGHGWGDGRTFGFWPVLIGGFFLYLSYYGCDQTQAQRILSTRSVAEANRTLFLTGLLRLPLGALYCLLGVAIGAYAVAHPEFIEALKVPLSPGDSAEKPQYNLAVPVFVLAHFPSGAIGLVFVGMFAAAMSSLDSTINSLSALTVRDIGERLLGWKSDGPKAMLLAKGSTFFWGILCMGFAFWVGDISDTVVESVNKLTSVLSGPILAVFMLGLFTKTAKQRGVLIGLALGLLTNIALWLLAPQISWLWWNPLGFFTTFTVGFLSSLLVNRSASTPLAIWPQEDRGWRREYTILVAYATVILIVLGGLNFFFGT